MRFKHSSVRRVLGFGLIAAGFVLFIVLLNIIPLLRLLSIIALFVIVWSVVICIAFGFFVLAGLSLRQSIRSLVIGFFLALPLFIVFIVPLPLSGNDKLLLAVLVESFVILLYRRWYIHVHGQEQGKLNASN